jgi:hypothetical protein
MFKKNNNLLFCILGVFLFLILLINLGVIDLGGLETNILNILNILNLNFNRKLQEGIDSDIKIPACPAIPKDNEPIPCNERIGAMAHYGINPCVACPNCSDENLHRFKKTKYNNMFASKDDPGKASNHLCLLGA